MFGLMVLRRRKYWRTKKRKVESILRNIISHLKIGLGSRLATNNDIFVRLNHPRQLRLPLCVVYMNFKTRACIIIECKITDYHNMNILTLNSRVT